MKEFSKREQEFCKRLILLYKRTPKQYSCKKVYLYILKKNINKYLNNSDIINKTAEAILRRLF